MQFIYFLKMYLVFIFRLLVHLHGNIHIQCLIWSENFEVKLKKIKWLKTTCSSKEDLTKLFLFDNQLYILLPENHQHIWLRGYVWSEKMALGVHKSKKVGNHCQSIWGWETPELKPWHFCLQYLFFKINFIWL